MSDERIAVLGVGNAGIQIVDVLAESAGESLTAIVLDADRTVLESSVVSQKVALGQKRSRGHGTGGDAALGKACAEDDVPCVLELLHGMKLVVLVCGLSGGMAGAAPVILDAARKRGALTLCFGIVPAVFEGTSRHDQADAAVARLRPCVDAIIAAPNDRLLEQTGEGNLAESFRRVNEFIAGGVRGVCQLISKPGFIRLSFADLQKVARAGGVCTFSYGTGRGRNRASSAADMLLASPTLEEGRLLKKARSVLVSIAGGKGLMLKEVGDIMDAVSAAVGEESDVIMGTVLDAAMGNQIAVTALVAGPDSPAEEDVPVEEVGEVSGQPAESRRRSKRKDLQIKLRLDTAGKGRFKDIEPTIMDGEDLDIPTFIRRNIQIER